MTPTPAHPDPADLQVHRLTRRFGEITALDEVTFTVPAGRMVGFVGGNGAGKTTTMRIVMGVLAADAGAVRWGGAPVSAADRARFGYMPEERGLYPKQKVLDQLVYLGRLHRMSEDDARARATEHLARFGLGDRLDDKLETLSLGNQQRVQIVAAVLHRPTALILDEPFSGLDPDAVDAMAAVLRTHCNAGVPVLFSSHQLDLVERLCDDVVVLARGRVVAEGTPATLRDKGTRRWRIVLDGDAGWVRGLGHLHVADVDRHTAVVEPLTDTAVHDLLAEAVRRGPVHEFTRIVPALSEIYREVSA
ncbi:MAG: ATP-binding cassette domain-containing protein [Dermatophilaceae bacterium]